MESKENLQNSHGGMLIVKYKDNFLTIKKTIDSFVYHNDKPML